MALTRTIPRSYGVWSTNYKSPRNCKSTWTAPSLFTFVPPVPKKHSAPLFLFTPISYKTPLPL